MKYNTRISIEPGLQDTYQVFNLDIDHIAKNIKVEVIIDGDQYVENDIPQTMHAGNSNFKQFEGINNENSNSWDLSKYGDKFKSLLLRYFSNYAKDINNSISQDIYENKEAYKNYNNQFNVIFKDVKDNINNTDNTVYTYTNEGYYLGYKQNSITINGKKYISKSLGDINGTNDNSYIFINTNIIHFSKYYNIYKSSNISIPVLQPVLHTKEDLDKLNMAISDDGNVWINSLSMFTAWNDKNGDDQDYRREYQYNCDIKNGKFYTKKDYMKKFGHDADEKWDYSQYRQHSNSKHFITDLDKVSEEDYNEYFPRGFMLFTLSKERNEMVINTDNIKSTRHDSKNVPSSWKQWFKSTDYTYHISKHGFANRVGDDTILAGLYYRGDKEDNVHLLNCWFTLQAYGEGDNRYVTQKIAYTLEYSTKKPLYIGTCIASVFANIYHYVKDTDIPIAQVVDTVYLSQHNTTYTKDMVYKISVNIKKEEPNIKEPSELLIFKGIMKYGGSKGYVEFVKKKAGATNDPQYSGDKNFKAIIRDCVKNVPLQYKLAYKEPNNDLINANNDLILLKTIDNPSGTRAYGKLSPNKLYQLDYDIDGKLSINNLTSTFKIKYLNSITLDPNTEIVSGEFSKWFQEDNNPNIYKTWSINDDLTLSNYRYMPTSSKYYSIIAAAATFKIQFADYDKDEILLPFAKFV